MILVDTATGSAELRSYISRQGLACEPTHLKYADACFEGDGPQGLTGIGVERKKLRDMLQCVDDGRYTGHQRVGMEKMYGFSFLIIEGLWRPDPRTGLLMFGYLKPDGTIFWSAESGDPRHHRVMYYKLRRYLFSMSLGGVMVLFSRDIEQTAYDICELFHYFQKRWKDHTALQAMHRGYFWQQDGATRDLMMLPTLDRKPGLVRRWAAELEGIGVKKSQDAERIFRTPRDLANSDEFDWLKVPGVGVETAQRVVKQIGGVK